MGNTRLHVRQGGQLPRCRSGARGPVRAWLMRRGLDDPPGPAVDATLRVGPWLPRLRGSTRQESSRSEVYWRPECWAAPLHCRRDDRTLETDIDQAESNVMRPRSLTIPDARGHGGSLRVTRHPEQRKVVISHWRDDVCVASTPIEIGEVPALLGVLADALGDAVRSGSSSPADTSRDPQLLDRIKRWLRPRLAQIVDLRPSRDQETNKRTG